MTEVSGTVGVPDRVGPGRAARDGTDTILEARDRGRTGEEPQNGLVEGGGSLRKGESHGLWPAVDSRYFEWLYR